MIPQLLVCDKKGRVINVPHLGTAGMKGGFFFRLDLEELMKLPSASRLFMLPDRYAVGYDLAAGKFASLNKGLFPVAAFLPPGFTVTFNSAYIELKNAKQLPLFSYGAVSFWKGGYYAAAVLVDKRRCHDPEYINMSLVKKKTIAVKRLFPKNRLIRHLETCALIYCCPGAQNFFLNRYEGPLPVSPLCNANCAGCISYQPKKGFPPTQPRIKFIPTPEEISEVALFHINSVKEPVVSFGQGCEGEPLMAGDVIKKAIRLIRCETRKGVINMNTNASRPDIIAGLFDAGLDSMRVSLNSARETYYTRYYKPADYSFGDVAGSIKIAKAKGGFVSVNYLTMPGFTDSKDEFTAVKNFIGSYGIDMIQWRNLNFDPLEYFRILKYSAKPSGMIGVKEIIALLKKAFPLLKSGYYNPPRIF